MGIGLQDLRKKGKRKAEEEKEEVGQSGLGRGQSASKRVRADQSRSELVRAGQSRSEPVRAGQSQ